MDGERRTQVLEILDYWRLIEFLGQIDIPRQKNENKKLRKNSKKERLLPKRSWKCSTNSRIPVFSWIK